MITNTNNTAIQNELRILPMVLSLSPDGSILASTKNFKEKSRMQEIESNLFEFIHTDDVTKCEKIIDNLTEDLTLEIDYKTNDGNEFATTERSIVFRVPQKFSKVMNEFIWVSIPKVGEYTLSDSDKYNYLLIQDENNFHFNSELVSLLGIENNLNVSEIVFDSNRRKIDLSKTLKSVANDEVVIKDIFLRSSEEDYLPFSAIIASHLTDEEESLVFILSESKPKRRQILEVNDSDLNELKEKIDSRDKFFSVIAHDLRSPFTAILGYSEYMASYYENLTREEIHDFSNNMYKASKSVFKLLEDLLKWTRIQSGKISLDKEIFSIVPTLNRAVEMFKSSAEKKNIRLIYNSNDFEILINADEEMISSVFRNLISNAIKFTNREGFIKIGMRIENGFVIVSVIDNGIGIDEVTQSKLFKVGERVTRYGTSDEEGSGLGLILSKEFVTKNGGDIWVESKAGEGSTFSVKIPISDSNQ